MLKRSLAERLCAFLITMGLALTMENLARNLEQILLTSSLSLILPGLGPAAILSIQAYFMAVVEEGLGLLMAMMIFLVVVLTPRYWLQSALWGLAVFSPPNAMLETLTLGSLIALLHRCTPIASAVFMASYVLMLELVAYQIVPFGTITNRGAVIVSGGAPLRAGGLDAIGLWLSTILTDAPHLLLQLLFYATVGALLPKLKDATGKPWLATLAGANAVLLLYVVISSSLGITIVPTVYSLPGLALVASLATDPPHLKLPRAKAITIPQPRVFPHLSWSWKALSEALRREERVILVFGPRGCGKTRLIQLACGMFNLSIADLGLNSDVILLENAEKIPDLTLTVKSRLRNGARCVILESSNPLDIKEELEELGVRTCIYVPPPDMDARFRIIDEELGAYLPKEIVSRLATFTDGFGLRALFDLIKCIKDELLEGEDPRKAAEKCLTLVEPDFTISELVRLEKFIMMYNGLIVGFNTVVDTHG